MIRAKQGFQLVKIKYKLQNVQNKSIYCNNGTDGLPFVSVNRMVCDCAAVAIRGTLSKFNPNNSS